jgi:hypothetical protein
LYWGAYILVRLIVTSEFFTEGQLFFAVFL